MYNRVETTFHMDFSIAERFGVNAIKETYRRAVKGWINDVEYYTELVIVLNERCWGFYQKYEETGKEVFKTLSGIYADLFYKARDKGYDHYKGEEFKYFWETLD